MLDGFRTIAIHLELYVVYLVHQVLFTSLSSRSDIMYFPACTMAHWPMTEAVSGHDRISVSLERGVTRILNHSSRSHSRRAQLIHRVSVQLFI